MEPSPLGSDLSVMLFATAMSDILKAVRGRLYASEGVFWMHRAAYRTKLVRLCSALHAMFASSFRTRP